MSSNCTNDLYAIFQNMKRFLLQERWSKCTFPYFSCQVQVKTLEVIYTYIKQIETEKLREDNRLARNLRRRKNTVASSLNIFSYCPRLNTREAGNSETPMGTDKRGKTKEKKKSPAKNLLSLTKGQGAF